MCIIKEIERSIGNFLILRCAAKTKRTLTPVKPWKWITCAVKLWKFKLVRCWHEVFSRFLIIILGCTAAERSGHYRINQGILDTAKG
jgi:hypothetical protein